MCFTPRTRSIAPPHQDPHPEARHPRSTRSGISAQTLLRRGAEEARHRPGRVTTAFVGGSPDPRALGDLHSGNRWDDHRLLWSVMPRLKPRWPSPAAPPSLDSGGYRRVRYVAPCRLCSALCRTRRTERRTRSRSRLLQDPRIASVVGSALIYGETVRRFYQLHAWVVMPNHVHAIFGECRHAHHHAVAQRQNRPSGQQILDRTGRPSGKTSLSTIGSDPPRNSGI